MKEILRDYQRAAVNKMKNGCILNGGVGSGKSRTSLVYFVEREKGKPLYIITTAMKRDKHDWEDEMKVFGSKIDISKVKIDSWNNIKKYTEVEDSFFIFDEDRVTGTGAWVKAFWKICKKNDWIILSATPGDCWLDYAPVFIANGFYKNITDFRNQHVIYSNFTNFPMVTGYVATKKLNRLRNDILVDMEFDRPTERHQEIVKVDYDKDIYKYTMKERWNVYENKPCENISELCYTLRKIVNSDTSRLVKVTEILTEHPKAIIFYNFDYELDELRAIFGSSGIKMGEWNGHNHQPLPKGKSWVYLVQYTAGAEGWNCITTDTMIFFSQNYSYKVMEQSEGRIDRMNTPYKDLYYYHLRSKAPIDLAITRALDKKQKFNESRYFSKFTNSREKQML